uniref:Uncharacterized protein n=1 Tax=Rhinopithecus bieti TaxID=61621 RepID=A0A2K6JMY9_RHIBE
MLGISREQARSGGVAGSPARSNLWSHRDCFLPSQDGFWVPLLPQTPRITPLPLFWRLIDTWTSGSSSLPAPALLPSSSPPLRLPYVCSEVWVPVAVGREEAAGSSPPSG